MFSAVAKGRLWCSGQRQGQTTWPRNLRDHRTEGGRRRRRSVSMTGATVLLGGNALVFIEQMLRPARPSINCPGGHALSVCLWRQCQRREILFDEGNS